MKLDEMLDMELLELMLQDGYMRSQTHPTLPLTIFNYSEKAQFEKVWNPVTRACRGLIVDHSTDGGGTVIARPFRKFFNYSENADITAVLQPDEPVLVTDKMDGSLGILFWYAGDWHVATRGSFASDQAIHATKLFRERYGYVKPRTDYTLLFEIIFPQNRIVLDYGGMDDLVVLGGVHIESGSSFPPAIGALFGWKGPKVEYLPYFSLVDALAAPPRPNAEGLVVHGLVSDERIKIKQEDYVILHRIVTGLSSRVIWGHVGEGKPLDDLLEPLPEEFHPWVNQVADELEQHAMDEEVEALTLHQQIVRDLPEGFERKDYARKATEVDKRMRGYLFLLLDGQTDRLRRMIWRNIKPERETPMVARGEDVA